jgi:hypothetical protein
MLLLVSTRRWTFSKSLGVEEAVLRSAAAAVPEAVIC